MRNRIIIALALLLVATLGFATMREFVLPGHTFVVDSSNRVLYGWGVRPTTPELSDGTPVSAGTPFWDSSASVLYYWSGTAWVTAGLGSAPDVASAIWGSSGRIDFEGATADAYETEVAVTDPTADRLVMLPNTSGTAVLANVFNYAIPDSGGVGAATYTLQAAGYRLATLSCLDADGCTVTMGETGLVTGDSVTIIQIAAGSGNITIVDDDGTTAELDGDANLVLNTLDSVTLHYTPGTWIVTAYVDIS